MTLNGLISFAKKKARQEPSGSNLTAPQADRSSEEPNLGTFALDAEATNVVDPAENVGDFPTPGLDGLSAESGPSQAASDDDDDWVSGVMDELLENDEPSNPEIAQLADGLEKIDVAELAASCDDVMRSLEARFAIRSRGRHSSKASAG